MSAFISPTTIAHPSTSSSFLTSTPTFTSCPIITTPRTAATRLPCITTPLKMVASQEKSASGPKSSSPSWSDHQYVEGTPTTFVIGADAEKALQGNADLRKRFEEMVRKAQDSICGAIEDLEAEVYSRDPNADQAEGPAKFKQDAWVREGGGGGISRVLANGKVFEKAGVNVSVVYGSMPADAVRVAIGKDNGASQKGGMVKFFACGVSSVMHPWNPMAPTTHFNYRYFETEGGHWWFGGGTDLTPSYLFEEDAKHFHGVLKDRCDKHDPSYYPKFKKWCDEYFMIKHRGETRGIGGIFFDDLNNKDPEEIFPFSTDCCNAFVEAYIPILKKRIDMPYTEKNKIWQQVRRGRYVEFNLVYDRGTIFGLKTGGRIESILMSLPLTARWEYDFHPEAGSEEEKLIKATQKSPEWF